MRKAFLLYAAICLACLPACSFAQSANFASEFGFRSDNDAYLAMGQDRYYTNGLFLTFRHAFKSRSDSTKRIWEIEAGQAMYNAQSGNITDIADVDRPFAAYLYAGFAYQAVTKNRALRIGLQAGTIGPAALGRQVQELLHSTVGFYEIEGWQYQVNNEFGINANVTWTQRLAGAPTAHADVHFEGSLNPGTTFSNAAAAAVLRVGKFNGIDRSVLSNSRIGDRKSRAPDREFFFYTRPKLALVVYDATVQGGLFSTNKGPVVYPVKPLVFSQELGLMFAAKRWTVDFGVTFLTRQVKSAAVRHQFGGVGVYYRFN